VPTQRIPEELDAHSTIRFSYRIHSDSRGDSYLAYAKKVPPPPRAALSSSQITRIVMFSEKIHWSSRSGIASSNACGMARQILSIQFFPLAQQVISLNFFDDPGQRLG